MFQTEWETLADPWSYYRWDLTISLHSLSQNLRMSLTYSFFLIFCILVWTFYIWTIITNCYSIGSDYWHARTNSLTYIEDAIGTRVPIAPIYSILYANCNILYAKTVKGSDPPEWWDLVFIIGGLLVSYNELSKWYYINQCMPIADIKKKNI